MRRDGPQSVLSSPAAKREGRNSFGVPGLLLRAWPVNYCVLRTGIRDCYTAFWILRGVL